LFVTHRVGSVPTIEFLDEAGVVIHSFTAERITRTLDPVWAWALASTVSRPTFPAGRYACRVSLDGEVVTTRPFTILG
jgi:hypothetical protein